MDLLGSWLGGGEKAEWRKRVSSGARADSDSSPAKGSTHPLRSRYAVPACHRSSLTSTGDCTAWASDLGLLYRPVLSSCLPLPFVVSLIIWDRNQFKAPRAKLGELVKDQQRHRRLRPGWRETLLRMDDCADLLQIFVERSFEVDLPKDWEQA